MRRTTTNAARMVSLAGVVALTDLTTKAAARARLDEVVDVGPLALRVVENTGVAFGLGAHAPAWVLLSLTCLVTVGLSAVALREGIAWWGCGLVVGGAVGNVLDRLAGGSVTDFFDLGWWPAFNLADVFIVLGVCAVLITARTVNAD